VIAWARAGVCGYVPRSIALSELVSLLKGIARGEQMCSRKIAASLLRQISRSRPELPPAFANTVRLLTAREVEVVGLIGTGLSNKEIARRLNIGLGTTKSHVHNALAKLDLKRRSQVAHWLHANPAWFDTLRDVAAQDEEPPFGGRARAMSSLPRLHHRMDCKAIEKAAILRVEPYSKSNRLCQAFAPLW
jgi:DNA-binding CsgD family transcriptional regulator